MPKQSAESSQPLNFDALSDGAFLRDRQLVAPVGPLPVSRATIWRWTKDKESGFPQPVKLSPQVTAWRVGDVREFIAKQAAQ